MAGMDSFFYENVFVTEVIGIVVHNRIGGVQYDPTDSGKPQYIPRMAVADLATLSLFYPMPFHK